MHFNKRIIPLFISAVLSHQTFAAIPNTDDPSNFLGPYIHAAVTNNMNDNGAVSVGADYGENNYRLNGTLAWQSDANQRFKASAEWLKQDLNYAFFSGNTSQWLNQMTIGLDYRYYFEDYYLDPQAGLDVYGLRSYTDTLRTVSGTYNNAGVPTAFVNARRIAGATSWGIAPGMSLRLWPGGRLGATLNYDNNQYDTVYVSSQDAKGLGGTLAAKQALSDNVELGVKASWLQAYNDYEATLDVSNLPFYGTWILGLAGNYTIGKNTMPSSTNIGLTVSYLLNKDGITSTSALAAREDFLSWTSLSAAYKPQALGVRDERVS